MGLQKSEYICIDHELMNKNLFQIKPDDKIEGKFQMKAMSAIETSNQKLNVQYCRHEAVKSENHEYLRFKAMFGQKQGHLKSKGQKLETQGKIHSYIEDNIDMFYKKSRRYFKKHMTNEQKRKITLQRRYSSLTFNEVLKGVFQSFLLDIAENLMKQRRLKIREKKYKLFKELQHAKLDNNVKHQEIDKIIEADYKYFGFYSKGSEQAINQIRNEAKNVETLLKQRNRIKYLQVSKEVKIIESDQINRSQIKSGNGTAHPGAIIKSSTKVSKKSVASLRKPARKGTFDDLFNDDLDQRQNSQKVK